MAGTAGSFSAHQRVEDALRESAAVGRGEVGSAAKVVSAAHTSIGTGAEPDASRPPADVERFRMSRQMRPTGLATALTILALGLAVAHFIVLLSNYENVFVHPDFHQANLQF